MAENSVETVNSVEETPDENQTAMTQIKSPIDSNLFPPASSSMCAGSGTEDDAARSHAQPAESSQQRLRPSGWYEKNLRKEKAGLKSAFTRARRQLTELISDSDTLFADSQFIQAATRKVDEAQERAMGNMSSLADLYASQNRFEDFDKVTAEMEKIEEEFADSQNAAEQYFAERREKSSSSRSTPSIIRNWDSLANVHRSQQFGSAIEMIEEHEESSRGLPEPEDRSKDVTTTEADRTPDKPDGRTLDDVGVQQPAVVIDHGEIAMGEITIGDKGPGEIAMGENKPRGGNGAASVEDKGPGEIAMGENKPHGGNGAASVEDKGPGEIAMGVPAMDDSKPRGGNGSTLIGDQGRSDVATGTTAPPQQKKVGPAVTVVKQKQTTDEEARHRNRQVEGPKKVQFYSPAAPIDNRQVKPTRPPEPIQNHPVAQNRLVAPTGNANVELSHSTQGAVPAVNCSQPSKDKSPLRFQGKQIDSIPAYSPNSYGANSQPTRMPNTIKADWSQPYNTIQHYGTGGQEPRYQQFTQDNNIGQPSMLEKDMWRQLKRVSIPVFSGDLKSYESWKAAFVACIDKAPATAEFKLLHLREHLRGEALKVIENLGHSATAYQAAKDRLDRKYGGYRRQVALHFEEIHNFRPIRPGKLKEDVEKFADLLDLTVINLKESGLYSDLDSRLLYSVLMKKMTEKMVAEYHRWLDDYQYKESIEVLHAWIIKEAQVRIVAHEAVRGFADGTGDDRKNGQSTDDDRRHRSDDNYKKKKSFFTSGSAGAAKPEFKRDCPLSSCQEQHGIWSCDKFKGLEIDKRWDMAKELKLCYRCLANSNHRGVDCKRSRVCGIEGCKETHNRLLHRSPLPKESLSATKGENKKEKRPAASGEKPRSQNYGSLTTTSDDKEESEYIALRTVPVIVKNGRKRLKINVLLDDGSTTTYINTEVAEELGLKGEVMKTTVSVLNGMVESFETTPVEVGLESLDKRIDMMITARTTDNVTGDMKAIDWRDYADKFEHLKDIAFPKHGKRETIDMLIGVDYPELHFSLKEVAGKNGGPIARKTRLGWTCVGCPQKEMKKERNFFVNRKNTVLEEINATMKQFWEIDSSGAKTENHGSSHMSLEDKAVCTVIQKEMVYKDNRYEVPLPWREGRPELPDNSQMAVQRLASTERRLLREPEVAKAYTATIKQYLEKNYVRKVPPAEEQPPSKWYLPHFPVVRPDKSTTKTRIVFDASAKFEGVSLNDTLHQGPKLQKDLVDVLLRFRKEPVALVGDIQQMYLQLEVEAKDRPFQRFLWRDLDTTRAPEEYEFNRVVFGINSSPFLAQFVAQEHAKRHRSIFPLASDTILKSTFIDDSMDSVLNDTEGVKLYHELDELWHKAGMYCRKWLSNSLTVLAEIPEEDRAAEISLDEGELPSTKTLGVLWQAKEDQFSFTATPVEDNFTLTKRTFLQKLAKVFDPMGFISPYIIRGKILMQEIWTTGVGWDDRNLECLEQKAQCWFDDLRDLGLIKIPRCLRLDSTEKLLSIEVHAFSDASQDAYGAVLYERTIYEGGLIISHFIVSKTTVAPLAATSIPRLELMGATLALHLTMSVIAALQLPMQDVTFWSDSANVLWWIRGRSRQFKPFVAHRIGEIQTQTCPDQWKHVPTKMNPADILTRGAKVKELSDNTLWWNGPEFLLKDHSKWPEQNFGEDKSPSSERKKSSNGVFVTLQKEPQPQDKEKNKQDVDEGVAQDWRLNPERYSSWVRLTRVSAWVHRFVENCQQPVGQRRHGELDAEEIHDAEHQFIRQAQLETFPAEYKAVQKNKALPVASRIQGLRPMIDQDGILRSNGRLEKAEFLAYDVRYPVILPRKSWVTTLIIRFHHEQANHAAGVNHILASLSAKYWIPAGREAIREFEKSCYECRRRKAKAATQLMAPLPRVRLRLPLRAFARTSVDFGGPYLTKQGRGRIRTKRYLCLFTCLLSRAVHLEMAFSLDTDSFLHCFNRMMNRRGVPLEMYSDNGTNFVSGERELRELVEQFDEDMIERHGAVRGIKWTFNPPLGPHFGGVHEIMIKAAKKATAAILGNADINDEELMTAFSGAEALLNSRPLTYQSADVNDDTPLTPNHLLHGQIGGEFAPAAADNVAYNPRKRWRHVQRLLKHFWGRWMKEWLPMLHPRSKWAQERKDIEVGDIVLVVNPDTNRGKWPLGRVVEVCLGGDGHVRVAKVQIGKHVMTRPITRLCPLECA
ncbi:uncharacterized protein LOC135487738 [Lineus longissimus]|uniref:uncharacterized protein LOC135487738 n=1 Tax=Lineus longissimus TaxID=88925 RepID=UPI00315C6998